MVLLIMSQAGSHRSRALLLGPLVLLHQEDYYAVTEPDGEASMDKRGIDNL